MIDWGYEQRLIDRIAARELLAGLNYRRRRILCASYLRQDTLREIAQAEGLSAGRVGQLVNTTMARLQADARRVQPLPAPVARALPPRRRAPPSAPLGFDRAAFLHHMRGLIERRDNAERLAFARERAELDGILRDEEIQVAAQAKAPPTSPWPPLPKLSKPQWKQEPPWLHVPFTFGSGPQRVEPWFDLARPLTLDGLREIARYTLNYLVAACRPPDLWQMQLGKHAACIVCARDADAIAGAMKRFADGLPLFAKLSARAVPVPEGWFGVTVARDYCVALRVCAVVGEQVEIMVTWDET